MRRYSCKSLSIMTAAAAAGILLPLSVQGMQHGRLKACVTLAAKSFIEIFKAFEQA